MEVRPYKRETDYPTLAQWWNAHKEWTAIPVDILPEIGAVVEGVCAGFLYRTDSKIAWIEWIISNPESEPAVRARGLDLVIEALLGIAKDLGFVSVFSAVKHPKLLERYKQFNFIETDRDMIHGIWRL